MRIALQDQAVRLVAILCVVKNSLATEWGQSAARSTDNPAGVIRPHTARARARAFRVKHVGENGKPVLTLRSGKDKSLTVENALVIVEALKNAGALFRFRYFPEMGRHGHQ